MATSEIGTSSKAEQLRTPGSNSGWTIVPRHDRSAPVILPEPFYNRYSDPTFYDPGEELTAAVNVALLLGQPLLLTGEPGSGKTSLAYWLARELGVDIPLVYVVKSTTSGRDLLYSFDELARFRDAQAKVLRAQQDYLELNALGQAILFSAGPQRELADISAPTTAAAAIHPPFAAESTGATATNSIAQAGMPGLVLGYSPSISSSSYFSTLGAPSVAVSRLRNHADLYGRLFPQALRQVVLIDELDKAPRDTPNDLLSEIERMSFRIPELGVAVTGDKNNRPVVVITSNSEKSLPEPFLRRCVFYNIPPADFTRRLQIVHTRRPPFASREPLFSEAMDLFERLRNRLGRAPGTAELLAWLDVLDQLYPADEQATSSLLDQPNRLATSLGTIAKTREDLDKAKSEITSLRTP